MTEFYLRTGLTHVPGLDAHASNMFADSFRIIHVTGRGASHSVRRLSFVSCVSSVLSLLSGSARVKKSVEMLYGENFPIRPVRCYRFPASDAHCVRRAAAAARSWTRRCVRASIREIRTWPRLLGPTLRESATSMHALGKEHAALLADICDRANDEQWPPVPPRTGVRREGFALWKASVGRLPEQSKSENSATIRTQFRKIIFGYTVGSLTTNGSPPPWPIQRQS